MNSFECLFCSQGAQNGHITAKNNDINTHDNNHKILKTRENKKGKIIAQVNEQQFIFDLSFMFHAETYLLSNISSFYHIAKQKKNKLLEQFLVQKLTQIQKIKKMKKNILHHSPTNPTKNDKN